MTRNRLASHYRTFQLYSIDRKAFVFALDLANTDLLESFNRGR